MASTSITTVGGVMVVTQVIPKDGSSIPLQAPADPAQQAPPPKVLTPPPAKGKDSKMFLAGEQQGLGVVQVVIGTLCVLFALFAVYLEPLVVYAPFGLGVVFVVSGLVAVAAGRRTSTRLVSVSMVSNVLSVLLGLVGVAYLCLLFAQASPYEMICSYLTRDMTTTSPAPTTTSPAPTTTSPTSTFSYRWWYRRPKYNTKPSPRPICPDDLYKVNDILYGLQGLVLVLLVLQVCVSVAVCVLSGKILRRRKHYSSMTVEADSRCLQPGSPDFNNQNRLGPETP